MTVFDKKYELHKTVRWGQAVHSTRTNVDQSVFIFRANAAVNISQIVTSQNDSPSSWAIFSKLGAFMIWNQVVKIYFGIFWYLSQALDSISFWSEV